jgi:hypothetical protein
MAERTGLKDKPGYYRALAEDAFQRIVSEVNSGRAITLEGIQHINPLTAQPCSGTFVSDYSSWEEVLNSESMSETGGVTAICAKCGAVEFINESRELVEETSG